MQMAAMPARSYSSMQRITLIALPYPLSQSAMTGIVVELFIICAAERFSAIVRMLASGTA
jgi:hypothetical protein